MPTSSKKTAKKAPKKAAAKKAAPKKTIRKKVKPMLVCASDAECFWVHEGPILEDLQQLRDALDEMDEVMYDHHVTNEKNDFADWVEFILKDKTLANALRKATQSKTAHTAVVKRLKHYR